MRIADVHTHIFPDKIAHKASEAIGGFYNTDSHHLASLEVVLQQEALAGAEYVAVSSSATTPEQVEPANTFIAQCAQGRPKVIPIGTLFPGMEHWEKALDDLISLGIRGIKIHPDFQKVPIDLPDAVPMYKAIAKAGLPVLFHMGDARYDYSAPERLERLIGQVPDLIAIAAHFGGWQSWEHSYEHVLPENVYYDTSSSLMYLKKERALDFLEKFGAGRFLFGSDFPLWTPKQELERFLALDLDASLNETILFGNFQKLFLA